MRFKTMISRLFHRNSKLPELNDRWLAFSLLPQDLVDRALMEYRGRVQGSVYSLSKKRERNERVVTPGTERIIEPFLNPLYDLEACQHKPRAFYLRTRKNGKYRWTPIGRLCLLCERLEWGRPLGQVQLPDMEAVLA